MQVPQIGLWQKTDFKQVSAFNSEITKSVRHFRVPQRIKWEKSQFPGHERKIERTNWGPALCSPLSIRASNTKHGQSAVCYTYLSMGSHYTTKNRNGNGQIYLRWATTCQVAIGNLWEIQSTAICAQPYTVLQMPKIRTRSYYVSLKGTKMSPMCRGTHDGIVPNKAQHGRANCDKVRQLWRSPSGQLGPMCKNAGHNRQQAQTGHPKIQTGALALNQCMGKEYRGQNDPEQKNCGQHATYWPSSTQKCDFWNKKGSCPSAPTRATNPGQEIICRFFQKQNERGPRGIQNCTEPASHRTNWWFTTIWRFTTTNSNSERSSPQRDASENQPAGYQFTVGIQKPASRITDSRRRTAHRAYHQRCGNGKARPRYHTKHVHQKHKTKEFKDQRLSVETERERHSEPRRSEGTYVMCKHSENSVIWHNKVGDSHAPNPNFTYILTHLRATHCVTANYVKCAKTEDVPHEFKENGINGHNIVGDSHAPIYDITPHLKATNCVKSAKSKVVPHASKRNNVNGHNIVGDSHAPIYHNISHSRATNCAESAKLQIVTHEIKRNTVNGHNIVGDSHAPIYHITPHSRATNCAGSAITQMVTHETKENVVNGHNIVGDSHAPIYNINPYLRATHGVTTNCVKSEKSEVVPHVTRENSVNVHNVVGDSHVTNPNITHTLSHLRATHCVASQVCDGTDTSDTGSQGHGNDSSFDSSCSNQSCNNVVGDSHLQDQQEESDEDTSDESEPNPPTESETELEQSKITRNSVKIVHWNTQGAHQKIAEIQAAVIEHEIDILLLQDTRFKPRTDGIAPLRVHGYHTYHTPQRKEPTKCHGLVTMVHHRLPSDIMDTIEIGQSTEVLSVRIWINKRPLDIHNVYKTEPFPIDLEPILSTGHRVLIAGDYNARHPSWCRAANASGNILRDQLDRSNNCILLNHPQVWTTVNDSVLDLAVCSPSLAAITDWDTLPELTSDHIAVQLNIHSAFTYTEIHVPKKYATKRADWQIYREELTTQLTNFDTSTSMEDNVDALYEAISKAADKAMPSNTGKQFICKYWTKNPGVQFAKRLANQATRKHRKRPTPESKMAMREAYKQYEKICTQVKHYSWYKWAGEVNNTTSPTKIWDRIRRCKGVPPREKTHNNPKQRANELCTSFAERCSPDNLGVNQQLQLENLLPVRRESIQTALQERADTDRTISMEELERVLRSTDTAPGEDGITYSMIYELPRSAKVLMLKIFNQSYRDASIPQRWKIAKIYPIPKGDGKFRPISLISCMAKLLDRIVLNRLLYSAIPVRNMALGFRKGVGTQDAFTNLVHHMSKNKTFHAGAVFLDIERAFEMIDKQVLLCSLAKSGVKGKLLLWLQSYLTDRQGFVMFQGKKSETKHFVKGIPQGSSLSPTLFNYVANALLQLKLPVGIYLQSYADDFVLYSVNRHAYILRERLQISIDLIERTLVDLGLTLSNRKTEAVWFNSASPQWELNVNGQPINWSKEVKYLGVILDKNLIMTKQSEYIVEKARQRMNPLKVLSSLSGVNGKVLKTAFTGCVRPILEYGATLMCLMSKTRQSDVQRVEHSALRLILRTPMWTPINAMYQECDLMPLKQRAEVTLVKFLYKALSDDRHPLHDTVTRFQNRTFDCASKNSWSKNARAAFRKLSLGQQPISMELHEIPSPWGKASFNKIVDDFDQ